jgi:hypothetical protein
MTKDRFFASSPSRLGRILRQQIYNPWIFWLDKLKVIPENHRKESDIFQSIRGRITASGK